MVQVLKKHLTDDPALREMLSRVAGGEYVNINRKITEFVMELQRSKHGGTEDVMEEFFGKLIEGLIVSLNLQMITKDGLTHLRKNKWLIGLPKIGAEIDRIILDRNNVLPLK